MQEIQVLEGISSNTTELKKQFYIESYGCAMNFSDSEIVASILIDKGYTTTQNFEEADVIFEQLANEIPWQQDDIRVFGKIHPQPRLTALFGNEGKPYSYSNIKMQPYPWNQFLQKIKSYVESITETNFTTVLLNYYRDGKDSNGWHADNEKELGKNPVIASVSFGTERILFGTDWPVCLVASTYSNWLNGLQNYFNTF